MEPFTFALGLAKVKGFFGKLFKSPWFYAALAFLAIGGGTYFYLVHDKKEDIATAVAGADSKATIQTYETKTEVDRRSVKIDEDYNKLHEQTTKDFANVRNKIETAPSADKDAQASPLLIDTLNELDRLRSSRDAGGVPDADAAVG